MKKLFNLNLRIKIVGLALAVNIALVIGAFFNIQQLADSYERSRMAEFQTITKNIVNSLAASFSMHYADVQVIADNESLRTLQTKHIQEALDQYINMYGVYDLILVLDSNGKLLAANQKDKNEKSVNFEALSKFDFAGTNAFKAARNSEFTEDKSKKLVGTYFEDVARDPLAKEAFGEERNHSSFAAPIKDYAGKVVGVVIAKANSRWYDVAIEESFAALAEFYPNIEFSLINKEGFYILQHHPKANGEGAGGRVQHDQSIVLNQKFFKEESEVSKNLAAKKSGFAYMIDSLNQEEDLVGYSYINHPKWLSSLGWSLVVHNSKAEILAEVSSAMSYFYWLMGIVSFLGFCFSTWAGFYFSRSVEQITGALAKNSTDLTGASVEIASGAAQLSEAATEQASALQQTVATIDEISAMIQKNSDAAQKSKELSAESTNLAQQGSQTVDSMLLAINEIESNNTEVSQQMTQTSGQLTEITKMIHSISNKTKVINEIVFQTKLLSFNASVEAARAGESGKGFAVVAEEVGKLAQMSGSAAKDISDMLNESVKRVENIIEDTKTKVEKLMLQSKDKVSFGSETVKQCKQALTEIIESVHSVDQLVAEIAVASKEQSTGVVQISQAINQLETVTGQNTRVAQSSSASSEQLKAQSQALNALVEELSVYVNGETQGGGPVSSQLDKNKKISQPVFTEKTRSAVTAVSAPTEKNILKFISPKKASTPKPSKPSEKGSSYKPVLANASGYDANVPSSDDPGFGEE